MSKRTSLGDPSQNWRPCRSGHGNWLISISNSLLSLYVVWLISPLQINTFCFESYYVKIYTPCGIASFWQQQTMHNCLAIFKHNISIGRNIAIPPHLTNTQTFGYWIRCTDTRRCLALLPKWLSPMVIACAIMLLFGNRGKHALSDYSITGIRLRTMITPFISLPSP